MLMNTITFWSHASIRSEVVVFRGGSTITVCFHFFLHFLLSIAKKKKRKEEVILEWWSDDCGRIPRAIWCNLVVLCEFWWVGVSTLIWFELWDQSSWGDYPSPVTGWYWWQTWSNQPRLVDRETEIKSSGFGPSFDAWACNPSDKVLVTGQSKS